VVTLNVAMLIRGRVLFAERAMTTRALAVVGTEPVLPAGVDPGRTLILVHPPESLRAIIARHDSPLDDVLVPWAVEPVTAAALEDARRRAARPSPWP
jgi:hypothetical protein